ncbi:MAG: GAF domain-containing SpoIIE family protein phosphatase [Chloroflexota bacterium]
MRDYVEWQTHHHAAEFTPSDDDDVDLRTYLSHLRINGINLVALKDKIAALERFYEWAKAERIITRSPFEDYNFDLSFPAAEQVHPQEPTLPNNLHQSEVERLRALSQISERLNSAVDIQSALDGTLETLLKVMGLQTAWVSMLARTHTMPIPVGDPPPHGFRLAAARGLPPGLERDDHHFLRRPPACHCQHLLLEGRFPRAVNVVECSRLRDSAAAAGDNQGLFYHASVPLISKGEPLGILNVANTEWQFLTRADLHFLSAVSDQLVIAVERAHFFELAEARRIHLEGELQIAHEVQAGLIPHKMPDIPGFGLAGAWHPAREVAGDFYDIFRLDEDHWGIVIGDVADKGTAAVLYMAMARSLILSALLRLGSPAAALTEVNQMIRLQYSSAMFVTVVLAVLDPKEQTLRYANAGHNPPIIRRAPGTSGLLNPTGAAIGLFDELQFREETIKIGNADVIFMYTDGVTEAMNQHMEEYGKDRLIMAIAAAPRNAGEVLSHVEADLNAFTQGTPQSDDVAFLALTKD